MKIGSLMKWDWYIQWPTEWLLSRLLVHSVHLLYITCKVNQIHKVTFRGETMFNSLSLWFSSYRQELLLWSSLFHKMISLSLKIEKKNLQKNGLKSLHNYICFGRLHLGNDPVANKILPELGSYSWTRKLWICLSQKFPQNFPPPLCIFNT